MIGKLIRRRADGKYGLLIDKIKKYTFGPGDIVYWYVVLIDGRCLRFHTFEFEVIQ